MLYLLINLFIYEESEIDPIPLKSVYNTEL